MLTSQQVSSLVAAELARMSDLPLVSKIPSCYQRQPSWQWRGAVEIDPDWTAWKRERFGVRTAVRTGAILHSPLE